MNWHRALALAALSTMQLACAARQPSGLHYAEVLQGPERPSDVAVKIREPSIDCRQQALAHVTSPDDILPSPLPPELRRRYVEVVRSLHPTAKQVLRRTGGIWFVRDLPGAAARFVPCYGDGGGLGLILVNASSSSLDDTSADAELPLRFWQLLGATTSVVHNEQEEIAPGHTAARYVLLHELGHALSLLAGEFALGPGQQFALGSGDGFLAFGWRPRNRHARAGELHESGGLVPMGLTFPDWLLIREALDSDATWLAPGYQRPRRLDTANACALVDKLPRAGFVTPTAASAPTEDYAELFAHAILADEGKIHPDDVFQVTLEGCPSQSMQAPYFAEGVSAKREYIERQLGL